MGTYIKELWQLPSGVRKFLGSEPFLGIAFGLNQLLFNLHMLSHGVSEVQIGTILAMGTLIVALGAIPFGIIADKYGRKRVLVSGLYAIAIGHLVMALGTDITHFATGKASVSLGMSMMISTEIPLLFRYCKTKKQQTQTYNLMFAFFTMFIGLGTLLGGYLPSLIDTNHDHYQNTLLVMTVSMTIVATARLFLPYEGDRPRKEIKERHSLSWFKKMLQYRPSKHTLIFVGFSVFAGMSHAVLIPYYNVILTFRFEWSDTLVAWLLTANGFVASLTALSIPILLEKWGLKRVAYAMFFLSIITTILLALVLPLTAFIFFFLLRNGGFNSLNNVVEGKAMEATGDEERSLHAALRLIGKNIGSTIGAYLTGFVLAAQNYYLPFLLSALILTMAFIYFRWIMLKPLEADLKSYEQAS
ncbi:hypothetical protein CR194_06210 [Salipaludibacillus keqinensis]|uniref:Major facilitator superfamily (MFS) profile domain-containing protein n=1 Tax=Salipaludibacillus keqinensis TaxID=2045207 RepID=A0A323TZS9_9BACI|nr:MFS transporter [Salipaludibacillus keqinensis]PYZ95105.1 hypothetical protein CR194_06210 [Salipaludibacillus keqinensis]